MKKIYLTKLDIKGIKTIDELVSLSFYKKTISRDMETRDYNIKGIYGTNGSGKTGIITAIDILKNLLLNPGYLSNPIVQNDLNEIISKKTSELYIEVEFVSDYSDPLLLFNYSVTLKKDSAGKYVIGCENLSAKRATYVKETMTDIFRVVDGEIVFLLADNDEFNEELVKKTTNLLLKNSLCSLLVEKILLPTKKVDVEAMGDTFNHLLILFFFANKLYVCMEESDDHREHIAYNAIRYSEKNEMDYGSIMDDFAHSERAKFKSIAGARNYVPKAQYSNFEQKIKKLSEFIRIFKSDLQYIEIDKKENQNVYVCDLIMVYESCKIHAEYESTGIKKLIRLYAYLKKMVEGEIVFIDEFDSNLHDVYLCALLEYLMEYGEGQLCFTTHNVGPMDVLRQHKKSIEFLSVNHKIYSWKTNGNYSPSKLYRNGMIEGSPFNIDSIDFIGAFATEEDS